jgi:hypothetical protein
VLNRKCISCHTHDRAQNRVVLTDDLTNQFTVGYEELLPYLSAANAMRWDHPDDVHPRPPYTYGSRVSPLMKLLEDGHHGVELSTDDWVRLATWIDTNAVYYDRYETRDGQNRRIFVGPTAQTLNEVHTRRCAPCHGRGEGRFDSWWRSLSWRDVSRSRVLMAPLAKKAGGWQRCGEPVFTDTDDPDYGQLLRALEVVEDSLRKRPRADLASIR